MARAKQIIEFMSDGTLRLLDSNLVEIVSKCKNLPLAIYSVVGECRTGKSFLLNIFLFFVKHNLLNNIQDVDNFNNEKITGFDDKDQVAPVTKGIWMWSEPIIVKRKDKESVAILLVDTQGMHNAQDSKLFDRFIFGFSMGISSTMIFNVQSMITEYEMEKFDRYGYMFDEIVGSYYPPLFVVRDWKSKNPAADREKYSTSLDRLLSKPSDHHRQRTTRLIGPKISLQLLPFPGNRFLYPMNDNLLFGHLDHAFKSQVAVLVQSLFLNNIKVKKGWNGSKLVDFCRNSVSIFNHQAEPRVSSFRSLVSKPLRGTRRKWFGCGM